MEFDGKILLDAYKDIPDYPYGEKPPFGCRHVWIGVAKGLEINPDGPNEPVNGAAAKENETEKSVGNGKIILSNDELDLSQKEKALLEIAGKRPLTNKIFTGTPFATKCEVKSYQFENQSLLGDYQNRQIRINSELAPDLNKCLYKISNGINQFTEKELFALNTYTHELIHSQSNQTIFKDIGRRAIKEGLTEYLARDKVKFMTGITVTHGAYDFLIDIINGIIKDKVKLDGIKDILEQKDISHIDKDFFKLTGIKDTKTIINKLTDALLFYE